MKGKWSVAALAPTYMVTMLAAFARLDVGPTLTKVELHAYWLGIILTESDAAAVWN